MLEKITDRKYNKTVKKIEEFIEYEKGRRDYYEAELRMGLKIHEAKTTLHMIEYHNNRIAALNDVLRMLRYI